MSETITRPVYIPGGEMYVHVPEQATDDTFELSVEDEDGNDLAFETDYNGSELTVTVDVPNIMSAFEAGELGDFFQPLSQRLEALVTQARDAEVARAAMERERNEIKEQLRAMKQHASRVQLALQQRCSDDPEVREMLSLDLDTSSDDAGFSITGEVVRLVANACDEAYSAVIEARGDGVTFQEQDPLRYGCGLIRARCDHGESCGRYTDAEMRMNVENLARILEQRHRVDYLVRMVSCTEVAHQMRTVLTERFYPNGGPYENTARRLIAIMRQPGAMSPATIRYINESAHASWDRDDTEGTSFERTIADPTSPSLVAA